jgi:uncharacterized protein YndB with AHSA1/START domain
MRSIETTLEINVPVEAVWKALTDPKEITNWFPLDASVEPGVGGSLRWTWDEEINWESRIEVWEPNRHLRAVYEDPRQTAASPANSDVPTQLAMDFTLEAQGGQTVLRLVHSGFGAGTDWNETYDGTSTGWQFELRGMKHYLENHLGTNRLVAWARTPIACSWEEAWQKLMSPDGLLREGSLDRLQEGKPYSIAAATGDTFQGEALVVRPPREFSATVANLHNSLMRVALDKCGKQPEAWIFLETFGLPEEEVTAFRDRWQKLLESLFSA